MKSRRTDDRRVPPTAMEGAHGVVWKELSSARGRHHDAGVSSVPCVWFAPTDSRPRRASVRTPSLTYDVPKRSVARAPPHPHPSHRMEATPPSPLSFPKLRRRTRRHSYAHHTKESKVQPDRSPLLQGRKIWVLFWASTLRRNVPSRRWRWRWRAFVRHFPRACASDRVFEEARRPPRGTRRARPLQEAEAREEARVVAVVMDVVATMDVVMAKAAVVVAEVGSSPWRKTRGPCC